MTEQASLQSIDQSTIFQPAVLEIQNFDQYKMLAQKVAAQYARMIVTDDTLTAAKQSRKELNAIINSLEQRRKDTKAVYEKPLAAYTAQETELVNILKQAKAPIDSGIQVYTEAARQAREDAARQDLHEVLEGRGLEDGAVPFDPTWANTGSKTKKLHEMADRADYVKRERERVAGEKLAIKMFAESKNLDAGPWELMVDQDVSQIDIMSKITQHVERLAQQAEEARKRKEAEAAVQAATQTKVADKVIDTETGEIVAQTPPEPEKRRYAFEMVGTFEQAQGVADYMRQNAIEFRSRVGEAN